MSDDDIIITSQHTLDPSSYVCKRIRFWFRRHGLDYERFKREGIPLSELLATGDQREKMQALKATALRNLSKGDEDGRS